MFSKHKIRLKKVGGKLSREIKFRAWNGKKKFMDSAWLIDWEHGKVCHSTHNQSELDDCVLMQFTGLKDKNGKEVYEGDVAIAWSEGQKAICEIKWGQGRVGFFLYRSPHIIWNLSGGGFDYTFEMIEVIGNKYENPELLTA